MQLARRRLSAAPGVPRHATAGPRAPLLRSVPRLQQQQQQQHQHQHHQQWSQPRLHMHTTHAPAAACAGVAAGATAAAASLPWLALAAALVIGVLVGLAVAKAASSALAALTVRTAQHAARENAELRVKVEELQQLVAKLQPMHRMRLRFTAGINKAVILGLVDQLLENKEVNIWWLPDSLERLLYFNIITLMLSVLDEVVQGVNVSVAGHNVKLQLTYLDLAGEGDGPQLPSAAQLAQAEAQLAKALQPLQ